MQTLLHQFREFASRQRGRYEYASPDNCACAQFTRHLGIFPDYRYKYLNAAYKSEKERATLETRFNRLEALASRGGPHTWEDLTRRIDRYIEQKERDYEERPAKENVYYPRLGSDPIDREPVYHVHAITLSQLTADLEKEFEALDLELV